MRWTFSEVELKFGYYAEHRNAERRMQLIDAEMQLNDADCMSAFCISAFLRSASEVDFKVVR